MKVTEGPMFVPGGATRARSSGVLDVIIRGFYRSIELASELYGATPFDDDGMGIMEARGAAPARFGPALPHVDWAALTGFDRGRIAREVLPSDDGRTDHSATGE
jgi:hypothetical protein